MPQFLLKFFSALPKIVTFASAIFVAATAAIIVFFLSDAFMQPQEPISLEIITIKLKPGEPLKYTTTYRRRKVCKTDVQRFVIRENQITDLEEVVYRDQIIGSITAGLSREKKSRPLTVISEVHLPVLPDGKYNLRVVVISTCTLIVGVAPYQEAMFEVRSE